MIEDSQLSTNFYYSELVHSETAERKGIPNIPPREVVLTAERVALRMEKVRTLVGGKFPVLITSWYRSPRLNKVVGGSTSSQHCKGEAVDFTCPGYGSPAKVALLLEKHKDFLGLDQLIYEHTWVHLSFTFTRPPRGEVLTLLSNKKYGIGITDKLGNPL